MTEMTVIRNESESRYDLHVDGELAGFAEYKLEGDRAAFTHTEVFEAHRGAGVAGTLAGQALADATQRGLAIVPLCPYNAKYLTRHDVPGATVLTPE